MERQERNIRSKPLFDIPNFLRVLYQLNIPLTITEDYSIALLMSENNHTVLIGYNFENGPMFLNSAFIIIDSAKLNNKRFTMSFVQEFDNIALLRSAELSIRYTPKQTFANLTRDRPSGAYRGRRIYRNDDRDKSKYNEIKNHRPSGVEKEHAGISEDFEQNYNNTLTEDELHTIAYYEGITNEEEAKAFLANLLSDKGEKKEPTNS